MKGLAAFILTHSLLLTHVSLVLLAIALIHACDQGRALDTGEAAALLTGQASQICLSDGGVLVEYFVPGGQYQVTRDRGEHQEGHWEIGGQGQVCVLLAGDAPLCRYVWRDGTELLWMWASPSRFVPFVLAPVEPCGT